MGFQFPDLHYYFKENKENSFNHDTERKRRIINILGKKAMVHAAWQATAS